MADTFRFDLVSPERSLASVAAREVQIPATDGDMTAMPGHASVITTLRPGLLRVVRDGGQAEDFIVSGGFAEVTATGVSVLAEEALPRAEFTPDVHSRMVEEARSALTAAQDIPSEPGPVDDLAKLLADMAAAGDYIAVGAPARAPAPG